MTGREQRSRGMGSPIYRSDYGSAFSHQVCPTKPSPLASLSALATTFLPSAKVPIAMRWLLAALVVLPALAGCTTTPPGPGPSAPPAPPQALVAEAPWWALGDAYTVRIEKPGAAATTWRMVNMWNDTETDHFWLGVADRAQALDMALFDTNPFMGRIHHHILTPHERGMHAAMYSFPLEDGKRWNGFYYGRNWSFLAEEAQLDTPLGRDRGFAITAEDRDGAGHRLTLDYSPRLKWLTSMREVDRSGQPVLTLTVTAYERGATGTYTFLRGLDFYRGPSGLAGTHEEKFKVSEQADGLAFYVKATAQGPLEIQLVDPAGQVRKRVAAATGGQATFFDEVGAPTQGEWKVRYVTTSTVQGQVFVIGLLDTTRSV